MNKETIELERDHDHIKGYGLVRDESWTEIDILNRLVEWSQDKDVKIYRHLLRIEEEDQPGTRVAAIGPIGGPYTAQAFPRCDRVKYLDIFFQ